MPSRRRSSSSSARKSSVRSRTPKGRNSGSRAVETAAGDDAVHDVKTAVMTASNDLLLTDVTTAKNTFTTDPITAAAAESQMMAPTTVSAVRATSSSKYPNRNIFTFILTCNAVIVGTGYTISMYALPQEYWLVGYLVTTTVVALNDVFDFCVSDSARTNFTVMHAAGYTNTRLAFYILLNLFMFQLPYLWMLRIGMELAPHEGHPVDNPSDLLYDPTTFQLHFNLWFLLRGFLTTLFTDILFYIAHRLMHDYCPSLHLLHHCCIHSSLGTNLIFHPIDLVLEFFAPMLTTFAISVFIVGDVWNFVIAEAVMGVWYSLSHDEFLQLQHTRHHLHCGTNYFIYLNWWKDAKSYDKVAKMLPRFLMHQSVPDEEKLG